MVWLFLEKMLVFIIMVDRNHLYVAHAHVFSIKCCFYFQEDNFLRVLLGIYVKDWCLQMFEADVFNFANI